MVRTFELRETHRPDATGAARRRRFAAMHPPLEASHPRRNARWNVTARFCSIPRWRSEPIQPTRARPSREESIPR